MPFRLPQLPEESKFGQQVRLPLLERYYPRELVGEVLSACHAWEQREKKLSQLLTVYYVIALAWFRQYYVLATAVTPGVSSDLGRARRLHPRTGHFPA